ncbi:MAG: YedE-related selenium metabolism membrane protein [Campylobacter sp.]|nr:YedE-related selenium metabolism membrane protein [Campylobacter sp.]
MSKTNLSILAGTVLGVVATLLVYAGNPGNMGICAACFLRDTTGALGFHRATVVQYVRPEIIGLIVGGFLSSIFIGKDYSPVGSSSPFVRFCLGVFAMIGCLVFLGCPWRAYLRLGGGDMSALAGVIGLVAGVLAGRFFKRGGYELDFEIKQSKVISLLPTIFAVILFLALVFGLNLGENAPLFSSTKGPASQHANLWISLVAGVLVGVAMQRSKFCSVGAISRAFNKDFSMLFGIIAIIVSASVVNLVLSQYHFGFTDQPIAHNQILWNFLGMFLAGLCFNLSNGCPGKHLVQCGSGNLNSAIFIIGMMAGAAISHNFILASSASGITPYAPYALGLGFLFCIFVGFKQKA